MSQGHISANIPGFLDNVETRNPDMVASARVKRAWVECMDQQVLDHTDTVFVIPNSDCSDILVYVDSNIWATELNLQAEMLRLKLNIALREMDVAEGRVNANQTVNYADMSSVEKVKRLRFKPSKQGKRPQERNETSTAEQLQEEAAFTVEPIALTAEEEQSLLAEVSRIENEVLRKAAFEAARADYELKKGIAAQAVGNE